MQKTQTNRKCIVTGKILPTEKLVRVNFDKPQNHITLDLKNQLKGRGCYFECNEENWQQITKTKGLNRAFRTNISREIYANIEKELREAQCLKKVE
ncbi:Putative transciprtional termination factor [Mycoplasmopsis bovigenitalium]|uniref:Transciprtional termination factor n=1 Tax=Mycoplasmopsis bovigenitalium TaxID=2112 RepID=A0A449A8I2_9BACT|nr:YlxR family protein [Mycoplasmopsis bovigenitalium]VEU60569.1 Putative transciprtional termination factor [Mycoplasmopsis bovigenitalium]